MKKESVSFQLLVCKDREVRTEKYVKATRLRARETEMMPTVTVK